MNALFLRVWDFGTCHLESDYEQDSNKNLSGSISNKLPEAEILKYCCIYTALRRVCSMPLRAGRKHRDTANVSLKNPLYNNPSSLLLVGPIKPINVGKLQLFFPVFYLQPLYSFLHSVTLFLTFPLSTLSDIYTHISDQF